MSETTGTGEDAFYEWLLSDHPAARAERDARRDASYQYEQDQAAQVRAWTDKVNARADVPKPARDLAASMGPLADRATARAEASHAEPDDLYVARLRHQHETYMQVSGPAGAYDYRYPAHLTGPSAARYDCPLVPQPDPESDPGLEPGALRNPPRSAGAVTKGPAGLPRCRALLCARCSGEEPGDTKFFTPRGGKRPAAACSLRC